MYESVNSDRKKEIEEDHKWVYKLFKQSDLNKLDSSNMDFDANDGRRATKHDIANVTANVINELKKENADFRKGMLDLKKENAEIKSTLEKQTAAIRDAIEKEIKSTLEKENAEIKSTLEKEIAVIKSTLEKENAEIKSTLETLVTLLSEMDRK